MRNHVCLRIYSEMATFFVIDAMVRGYRVYEDIWTSNIEETLPCYRESCNGHDPFSVAVFKQDE